MAFAVRGPRTPLERKQLEDYLSGRDDIEADWFDVRDDEALGAALRTGSYHGCLFADLNAAMDAAVAGDLGLDPIVLGRFDLRLASGAGDASGAISVATALQAASESAAMRRDRKSRRQTIAGAILSMMLLAAVAGLLLAGHR